MAWTFYDSTGAIKRVSGLTSPPTNHAGQGYIWNGSAWVPQLVATQQSHDDLRDEFEGHSHTPERYYAAMYLSTQETHTATDWRTVGANVGVFTSLYDVRPGGVDAQVDTAGWRIYARKTGLYLVIGKVTFSSIATDKKIAVAIQDSAGALLDYDDKTVSFTTDQTIRIVTTLSLNNGDFIRLGAYQNDSASETIPVGTNYWTRLSMMYIGPTS